MDRGVQLFTFKKFCDESSLEKVVLECGAGVFEPEIEPLFARFARDGYRVYGIDIGEDRLANARAWCEKHKISADLRQADARAIPFGDNSTPCVYAHDVAVHGRKADMRQMTGEMARVLMPGGIMFVNYLSLVDDRLEKGKKIGEGEYLETHGGHEVIHNYLQDDEAEGFFKGLTLLYKQKRIVWKMRKEVWRRQAYLDYILQKD